MYAIFCFLIFDLFFVQKLYAVEKMSQGSGNMFQMNDEILSPSSFAGTPLGLSPAASRQHRRTSSASSILSMDSDSDGESTQCENRANSLSRARSESVLTSTSSSTHSWEKEKDREQIEERCVVPDDDRCEVPDDRRSSNSDELPPGTIIPPDELLGAVGGARPRSDSLTKIYRSSSAPQHERPRVESALSRSSSDPLGPKHYRELRDGLIIKRRTLEEDNSFTSSSISLDDSETFEFPSLPARESVTNDLDQQSPRSDFVDSPPAVFDTFERDRRGSTTPQSEPSSPCDLDGISGAEEVEDDSSESPGLQALHSLTESIETSLKSQPTRQTPRIKSPLIAQQKLNSAIYTSTEATQRKRANLPRRSSPVMSRKPNPEDLMRSRNVSPDERTTTKEQEIAEIMQKIRDSPRSTSDSASGLPSNQTGTRSLPAKLVSRHSEPTRAPLKPDRSHYPMEEESVEPVSDNGEKSSEPQRGGRPGMPSRKKSMSLSDLLNLGRELTSGRSDKTKDKDRNKEKEEGEQPESPLSADDRGKESEKRIFRM